MIILMDQKGITTREISDLIEKMYGHYYSAATISNLSDSFKDELDAYRQEVIQADYVCLYCDASFIPVRRGSVSKEAVHIIVGIDAKGYKKVLDSQVYYTESALHYREMLQDLKRCCLQQVLLFVSDELTGYTNNRSESINKQLKRRTKTKEQFPHDYSLEKTVYCYVSEYNTRFSQRIHKVFGQVTFELEALLEQKQSVRRSQMTLKKNETQVS